MSLIDVPIEKGDYCPRRDKPHCIGKGCHYYGNPGCKIYNKRISLSNTHHAQSNENLVDSQSDSATNSKRMRGGEKP